MITIRDIKTFVTAPGEKKVTGNQTLIVVKIETSEPGLYGLGCATYTQRAHSVQLVISEYLKPLLVGRDVSRISDIWQLSMNNGYWRNGPVLNNAISGIDIALWDIKGKVAGLPIYDLLGGKVSDGALIYRHAEAPTPEGLFDQIDKYKAEGVTHVRCQLGGYGGVGMDSNSQIEKSQPGEYFDPKQYAKSVPILFEKLRERYGDSMEFLHDIHERLQPREAIKLAVALEPYNLFILEDAVSPELMFWLDELRSKYVNPIAMGELFVNSNEWLPLIQNLKIDYLRCHITAIGGLTPAIKLATLCETYGIKTAWHGPADLSPIGHTAQLHLDLASPAFGIQEWSGVDGALAEVFPGAPTISGGYASLSDRPGLGIDFDEKRAGDFPADPKVIKWTQTRYPDGRLCRP